MQHALMYHGGFERNFANLKAGATTFQGSDGAEHKIPDVPHEIDGLRVSYMEKPGKHFVAVRVQDAQEDIVLMHEVLLDPLSHLGFGKRFSPEPTVLDDDQMRHIIEDVIKQNPEQRDALFAIRSRIPR